MDWVAWIALLWIVGAVYFGIISPLFETFRYRRDPSNPYRRFCKKCGQQQGEFGYHMRDVGWWEQLGKIDDPYCECHKACARYDEFKKNFQKETAG